MGNVGDKIESPHCCELICTNLCRGLLSKVSAVEALQREEHNVYI